MSFKKLAVAVGLASASMATFAADDLSIDAYGTIAVDYYNSDDGRGYGQRAGVEESYSMNENTRLGVQAKYDFTDSLSGSAQALVQSQSDSWGVEPAWAYLDYEVNNDFNIRAGRLRLPIFGESEVLAVGYAYPWVQPPEEMYQQVVQSAYEGVDALASFDVAGQQIDAQVFGGTTLIDTEFTYRDNRATTSADWVYGLNLGLPTAIADFRFSYVKANVNFELDETLQVPTGLTSPFPSSVPVNVDIEDELGHFYSAGFKRDVDNVLLIGEWGKRYVEGDSIRDTEAFYLTAGYRIDWTYLPHITYAQQEDLDGEGKQTQITLGLRWDVMPGVSLKGEVARIEADDYSGLFNAKGGANFVQSDSSLGNDANMATIAVDFVY
jgi:hypothetical protein